MAKLAILALALASLVAFTSVTALRTTITTTAIGVGDFIFADEEQQTCHRQVQKEWVRDCKKYLTKSSPYAGDVLKMPVMDPRQEQEQEHLFECCEELRGVDEECQCKAVRLAFRLAQREQQSAHRAGGEHQQQHLLKKAQNIPSECHLRVKECSITSLMF
ncbi:PawS-like protein 1a [Artemisia annua]|uniref:PawS-like protein 1a n=1 Tax=Artemisia annua TaxID=35608 RepID=A0A2U1KZ74_ARTAN|nr:PawS-like protein 1a [Artemisia annua]